MYYVEYQTLFNRLYIQEKKMIGKRDICIECVYQLDNVSCFTQSNAHMQLI